MFKNIYTTVRTEIDWEKHFDKDTQYKLRYFTTS